METEEVIKFLQERKKMLSEYLDTVVVSTDHALEIAERMDAITSVIADLKSPDYEQE